MRALYVRHALVGYLLPRSLCLQPLFPPLAGCTHLNGCGGMQLPCNVCQNSVSAFAYTCHVRNLTRIIEGSYMQTCYVVKRYVPNHILLPLTAYYLLQSVCFPVPTLFGYTKRIFPSQLQLLNAMARDMVPRSTLTVPSKLGSKD